MDHPLTSTFQGLGFVLASLLSLFHSSSQAQVISGLTAYQSGPAIVLELANISAISIDALSFYYSRDGGSSWELINDNCLSPVSSRSVEWKVLECMGVEEFAGNNIRFKASASSCSGTVRFDEYNYRIVEIGDQCWFAENLRTTTYANGDLIPGNLTDSEWTSTTSGATTIYGEGSSPIYGGSDDEVANLEAYGQLYNWYAVDDSRSLCPSGWHVPTDGEWMTLEMELGITPSEANGTGLRGTDQGAQMKSSSSDISSWKGTNTSGFSALPGGLRDTNNGSFIGEGGYGYFWSASSNWISDAWSRSLLSDDGYVYRYGSLDQRFGFSVRCLRDE